MLGLSFQIKINTIFQIVCSVSNYDLQHFTKEMLNVNVNVKYNAYL